MGKKKTEQKTPRKGNVCGIIGLCIGWLIPIAGLILGIIALVREEKNKEVSIMAIVVSVVFWLIWMLSYLNTPIYY